MKENTEVSRLATTDIINNFILAVICSFASKLVSQENDTVAKAAEEVLRAYTDANRNIDGRCNEKEQTANYTHASPFDKHVLTDPPLSPIDKAVYSVQRVLADNDKLKRSHKVEIIATHASCSQCSVQTSLNTLEERGLIRRQNRFINYRQISSLYTVIGSQKASCSVNIPSCGKKNNTSEGGIQSNASCAEEVSNPADQNPTYFEVRKDEGCNEYEKRNDCIQSVRFAEQWYSSRAERKDS